MSKNHELLREILSVPIRGFASRWGSDIAQRGALLSPDGSEAIVDRPSLDRAMCMAAARAGASLREKVVHGAVWRDGCWLLQLSDGQSCVARVVVDASGRRARLGRQLGARLIAIDKLVAETIRLPTSPKDDHDHRVLTEATSDGWLFGTRDAEGCQIVSYFHERTGRSKPSASSFASACHQSGWFADIGRALPHVATEIESAATQFVDCTVLSRAMIVGDAAQTYDPLSSKGVSQAIADATSAAAALVAVFTGKRALLRDHERERWLNFFRYLKQRQSYYALEQRWADRPFWQMRASGDDVRRALSSLAKYSSGFAKN